MKDKEKQEIIDKTEEELAGLFEELIWDMFELSETMTKEDAEQIRKLMIIRLNERSELSRIKEKDNGNTR